MKSPPAVQDPSPTQSFGVGGGPLTDLFYEIWLFALTQPTEATYQRLVQDPGASVQRAALWLALGSGIGYVLGAVGELLQGSPELAEMMETTPMSTLAGLGVVGVLCFAPLAALFGVLIAMLYAAVLQFVAGAFGGSGSFRQLFYGMAAYGAPMTLVTSVLGVFPYVGPCLASLVSLYGLYLSALVLKAVNRFSWGYAVATLLVPLFVLLLVGIILFFLILFPALQSFWQAGPEAF